MEEEIVAVPRRLLEEVLHDGTCPLHVRLQLQRALHRPEPCNLALELPRVAFDFHKLEPCLPEVVVLLALPDIMAVRVCNSVGLIWAMLHQAVKLGGASAVSSVHTRIRTRLWIQRVAELNRDTTDETVFETPLRRLADDALRRRMETEVADARHNMETQIQTFQMEVDRRMDQYALRVHAIVEERVQQQLDAILAVEMDKVRTMVEGRIRAVVQREVHQTVCDMQERLEELAKENERLRGAFLEQLDQWDRCLRSIVWALSPSSTGFFTWILQSLWCCRRRVTQLPWAALRTASSREALGRSAADHPQEQAMQTRVNGALPIDAHARGQPAGETSALDLAQDMQSQLLAAITAAAVARSTVRQARLPEEPQQRSDHLAQHLSQQQPQQEQEQQDQQEQQRRLQQHQQQQQQQQLQQQQQQPQQEEEEEEDEECEEEEEEVDSEPEEDWECNEREEEEEVALVEDVPEVLDRVEAEESVQHVAIDEGDVDPQAVMTQIPRTGRHTDEDDAMPSEEAVVQEASRRVNDS